MAKGDKPENRGGGKTLTREIKRKVRDTLTHIEKTQRELETRIKQVREELEGADFYDS